MTLQTSYNVYFSMTKTQNVLSFTLTLDDSETSVYFASFYLFMCNRIFIDKDVPQLDKFVSNFVSHSIKAVFILRIEISSLNTAAYDTKVPIDE